MTSDELERVKLLASAFRSAIERCKPRLTYIVFRCFPLGSCGDTCDLLGRFLQAKGLSEWTYVSGRRGDRTHAWLTKDGVVVDITADQFEDAPGTVIVTPGSAWHQHFEVSSQRPAGATCPAPEVALQIEDTFRLILAEMDGSPSSQDAAVLPKLTR